MDRTEEYSALLRDLEELPPALAGTVGRAMARRRRLRLRRCLAPAGSAAAVFAAFVLAVNLWTPFALACGRVPILKELAAAVALSPSLKTAVEHDYVQYLGQRKADGGIAITVEYVIVDQRQVNLFLSVDSPIPLNRQASCMVTLPEGHERAMGWNVPTLEGDGLHQVTVDFAEGSAPSALTLELEVWADGADTEAEPAAASFTFDLAFDPEKLAPAKTIPVGQWLELDGQRVYVRELALYPTQARLALEDGAGNTAWLRGLDAWLEDETGRRYGPGGSIVSTGGGTPFHGSYHFESPYFDEPEELTLYIAAADWVDKELRSVTVDLDTLDHGPLPEGVELLGYERRGDVWELSYAAPVSQPFTTALTAPDGSAWSSGGLGVTDRPEEDGGGYRGYLLLEGYPYNTVTLELNWTGTSTFEEPIALPLTDG